MRRIARFLLIVCLIHIVCWATCSPILAKADYAPGELLVRFKSVATSAYIGSVNEQRGCEVIREIKFIEVYHLRITSGLSVEEAVQRYSRDPNVEFAEPNYLRHAAQVPDNPRVLNNAERWPNDPTFNPVSPTYGTQWGLDNWGQTGGTVDADIDAPQMWRMITDAPDSMVVAILDTGIDWDHEDLAPNIWENPGEISGDGVDNDGNGYIDDVRGWDFVDKDNDPDDPDGHGTHVAGIVGAVGNNGKGVAGVCWSIRLMAVRILGGTVADECDGIYYAISGDAKIINMSFGSDDYSVAEYLAIQVADLWGVLVVAAAGNDGRDIDMVGQEHYPAGLNSANLIAVAASDHNDTRQGLSNWGATSVDLAAPGDNIYSTTPGNAYDYKSGTSMAAPHVSGVAALCWSLEPGLTHLELKDVLLTDSASFNAADKEKKSAFKLGGVGEVLTEGRLRAAQNADFGDASDPPYPTSWPPLGWGALHLDCGLEWLGYDISLERDASNLDGTDTDRVPNLVNMDRFDDGVTFSPPYFCAYDLPDAVTVEVTVSNPMSGRYGQGKFLYLSSFFDFNDDGDWGDIFTCMNPGDAPEHLLIQGVAGPGATSVVNPLPDNVIVIDPSLWGGPPTKQSMSFTLFFYSPPHDSVADLGWTRFRLEYDDKQWPSPDNKFVGTEFDHSLFGEVEDYWIGFKTPIETPYGSVSQGHWWNDQFAEDGTLNPTSSADTRTPTNLVTTPPIFGDTLVCYSIADDAEVYFVFKMDKIGPRQPFTHDFFTTWFPTAQTSAWQEARMDTAEVTDRTGVGTDAVPGAWMSAFHEGDPIRVAYGLGEIVEMLPNNLFVPGTRIEYFLKARYIGSSEWFLLPDTTTQDPEEFEILPMYAEDGSGGLEWPCLIVADHFGRRGNMGERNSDRIGRHLAANGYEYDIFSKLAPSSDVGGIGRMAANTGQIGGPGTDKYNWGPGATIGQFLAYTHCMLNSGDQYENSMNQSDVSLINSWLTMYSRADRLKFFWLSGDQVVRWLNNQAAWGRPFINNILGSTYIHRNYASQNNDYTYCLPLTQVAGGRLNAFNNLMVASMNNDPRTFTVVGISSSTPNATAERQYDSRPTPRYASVSNEIFVVGGANCKTMSEGYDNCVIRTDGSLGYPACGNDNVLANWFAAVLTWSNYSAGSMCTPGLVGIDDPYSAVPPAVQTSLADAYPNPMNPTATIRYTVGAPGRLMLRVFDVTGRVIRTLVDDTKATGAYAAIWDGRNDRGEKVASGVFFYQLEGPGYKSAKKLVILQ